MIDETIEPRAIFQETGRSMPDTAKVVALENFHFRRVAGLVR